MKLPIVNSTQELITQIDTRVLYFKLVKQINKDFELIGLAIEVNENKSSLDLLSQLKKIVSLLIQQNFNDFLNLLYRIDISEQQITKIINSNTVNIEDQISFLILKREWQKVWFKEFYQK